MKSKRRSSLGSARRALPLVGMAFSALLSAGCMEYDADLGASEIPLTVQVKDWREEVIYQVLIDRFADGDSGNNWRVDTSSPGKWHGGDWKGLEEKLPYLEGLGVTTLWISPVVKNVDTDAGYDGYHGYWAQDLTQTNPHYGDLAALRRLVKSAHDRKMKVVLDIVTNHMGQLFFYDINQNGQPDDPLNIGKPPSPVVEKENEYDPKFDPRGVQSFTSLGESGLAPIIFVHDPATNHVPPLPEIFQNPNAYNRKGRTYNFDDPDQLVHGDFPGGLKDVNTELCEVREAMVDVYARWIELSDIDGLRIDTIKHVERGFWRYFTQKIRQRLASKGKTNFYMFGEAFDGRDNLVGSYTKNGNDDPPSPADLEKENACVKDGTPITGDQLDGVFYFPQYFQAVRDVFRYRGQTETIQKLWEQRPFNYGTTPAQLGAVNEQGVGVSPQNLIVNFLDNHDVPRFLFEGAGNWPEDPFTATPLPFETRRQVLHNALLFLFTAPGIPCIYYGTEQGFKGGNDPSNREDMWLSGYDMSSPTYQWIKRLSDVRKRVPALTKGEVDLDPKDGTSGFVWTTTRTGDEPDAGIFAFERKGGDAGDSYALVVINSNINHESSPQYEGTPMAVSAPEGTVLVDVLSDDQKTFQVTQGRVSITLPASSGAILVPQNQL